MATLRTLALNILFVISLGSQTWQQSIQNHGLKVCGQQSRPDVKSVRRGKRIVGGSVSRYGKWPWMASLIFNNSHYCAGSIVRRKWIVTTSHCFHAKDSSLHPKDWSVKVGKFNLTTIKKEKDEQHLQVKRVIRHPNYLSMYDDYNIDVPDDNDVALLELVNTISYSKDVGPICLLGQNDKSFPPNYVCNVAGWGHTKYNGSVQDVLHDVNVALVNRTKCNSAQSYNGSIHERAICAGYESGGRDACQYDSGGPLVCERNRQWYLVGQVSWGDKCALPHKYGVYSNMKLLAPWVIKTMAGK